MNETQIPITIPGIDNNIYAGFLVRFASMLLDAIIMLPLLFIVLYLNGLSVNMYFYTIIPNLLFGIWYNIYLPKKYGGTPGKLIAGIKIIKMDGKPIGWKEAILRHSVLLALTVFSVIIMIICLLKADETVFNSLSWLKRTEYLMSLAKTSFMMYTWAANIWIYGEFIVLLTNKRKRAAHDLLLVQ
ncbi:RDD family protein [Flavobacterium undicola]|uniref:RDD family protein n=1 Tax=Flavobacterium undicola TaxID=1932779 RepID=UPI00137680F8|nr:RDD family protein [Flavobacterium undicola]MBA0883813.1 RDD family protein [Flavobacterium undicola]